MNGALVYLLHQLDRLDLNPGVTGLRMVVFGHSHKAAIQQKDGVWFCNPGSIGPRRFRLAITLVRFTLAAGAWAGAVPELVPAAGVERFETREQFSVRVSG